MTKKTQNTNREVFIIGNEHDEHAPPPVEIELASVSLLHEDEDNARRGSIDAIDDSLKEFGQHRLIVAQRDGRIVVGNHLYRAARKRGWSKVLVQWVDDDYNKGTRRGLADNATGDLATWDTTALLALHDEIDISDVAGFSEDALEELRKIHVEEHERDKQQEHDDEIPLPPVVPATREGDLWLLGPHRVLCGDCASVDNVERLGLPAESVMITDPPYNVGFAYTENIDDEKGAEDYREFSEAWFNLWASLSARQIVTPGCVNLSNWCRWFEVYHCAPWTKLNAMTNGKTSRWWCWEPILFFGKGWGKKRANDVFDFSVGMQKDTGNHPCPKPIKLWVELIEQYTNEGAAIAEPFGGSGTTLIAAEKTGRTCFATELDTGYTDLQVKRWQDYTGKDATLDGDGRTFAEVKAERVPVE